MHADTPAQQPDASLVGTRPLVGAIGLGIMGAPMARNLLRAGFPLVVWNRTAARAEALVAEGAQLAASPREVAERAAITITMLSDSPDVEAVYGAPRGRAGRSRLADDVLVDMSTIAPRVARELAQEAAERGAAMLDAPVSGGDVGAQEGRCRSWSAATPTALERARPGARGARQTHHARRRQRRRPGREGLQPDRRRPHARGARRGARARLEGGRRSGRDRRGARRRVWRRAACWRCAGRSCSRATSRPASSSTCTRRTSRSCSRPRASWASRCPARRSSTSCSTPSRAAATARRTTRRVVRALEALAGHEIGAQPRRERARRRAPFGHASTGARRRIDLFFANTNNESSGALRQLRSINLASTCLINQIKRLTWRAGRVSVPLAID